MAIPDVQQTSEKARRLLARLKACDLCPRRCLTDRTRNVYGLCRSGANLKVASYNLHFGEEPPISGTHGSGTIFLAGCNLMCVYCQNYDISQLDAGVEVTEKQFVDMMLQLQDSGAHNINLVTPTHFSAQLVSALEHGKRVGLEIPVVYNSSGYDAVDTLREFEGLIDIYMPDMRYSSGENASCYSSAPDYPEINRAAVKEMHRQVGDLKTDGGVAASRGLLVRHLVLPESIAGTREVFKFIAEEISTNTYVSLMSQYRPAFKATHAPQINRPINREEYLEAVALATEFDLTNCRFQRIPS